MSSGIDNNVDWVAAPSPKEQVGPGLSRPGVRRATQAIQRSFTYGRRRAADTPPPGVGDSQRVMDKLLGRNSLAALDERGSDPYNATGRQFRR